MPILLENGAEIPEQASIWTESVPEGNYELDYVGHRFSTFQGRPKLEIYFHSGDWILEGLYLPRYYNLNWVKKSEGKTQFRPPLRGDFVTELVAVFGPRVKDIRLDRVPLTKLFSGQKFECFVRMAIKNSRGEAIPEGAQQPVVGRLLRLVELESDSSQSQSGRSQLNSALPNLAQLSHTSPTLVEKATAPAKTPDLEEWYGNDDIPF